MLIRPALLGVLCIIAAATSWRTFAQERPVFRTGVELIQLDVSVLDKHRRPVRGLTAADFTILEHGKPQKSVVFNAIDIPDPEADAGPPAAEWVRDVAPDVRVNTSPDGRLLVILMDDGLIPFEPWIISHAKAIARGVVDRMRPGDLASVMFTASNINAQDFTDDRARLLRAIDTFRGGWSSCGGTREWNPKGGLITPFIDAPMNVLFHLTDSLAAAPQRRKAVIFVSVALPSFRGDHIKQEMYRRARFANVSIYPVDPGGSMMEAFLVQRELTIRCGEPPRWTMTVRDWRDAIEKALDASRLNRETLQEVALNTGGVAVLDNNDAVPALDRIFEENASYYVLGYESPKRSDKFRRIEVKVNRPDVTVRARNMWKPPKAVKPDASSSQRAEHSLASVIPAGDVPMRITLAPLASPGRAGATLALAVGITEPVPASRVTEKIDLVIGAFTPEGAHRATQRQEVMVTLVPSAEATADIDILAGVDLKPGRYSIRVGAFSGLSRKGGSVYADVDVPDFAKDPLSLSGPVLSSPAAPFAAPKDRLAKLVPVVPTTLREFRGGDAASACIRAARARWFR